MKKLSVVCKGPSASAVRLARALSEKLGYKVFKTSKEPKKRLALRYGPGVDKISQYNYFREQGIPALEYTTDPQVAWDWANTGHTVFGRQYLNSSCGKGIVVFEPGTVAHAMQDIPVYTKYKKKKREFRVHVFRDTVVAVKEKKLRKDWNGPRDSKIRNLANGFVFCNCEDVPNGLRELAIRASACVGSDFKGVDVGYNEKKDELFVIEVNSQPGIEGSNINSYVESICNEIQ